MLVNASLNRALRSLLGEGNVVLIGEDISDPYGGAFKVTKGLSTRFPEKVFSSPVSEAGITGLAIGLSMMGYRPIVEIMFGDFLLLAADQIVNHLSKFHLLHKDLKPVSLVIRTPMGAGRGYGPTHSQSLERHFFGVDGISVWSLNMFSDAGVELIRAINADTPVLFIEQKVLYGAENQYKKISQSAELTSFGASITSYRPSSNASTDFQLVTYGAMSKIGFEVVNRLSQDEGINGQLIVPTILSPIDGQVIEALEKGSDIVVFLEESKSEFGFSAEICALLGSHGRKRCFRIGSTSTLLPASRKLEDLVIPTKESVYERIIEILEGVINEF
jgi:pyruvate/2-oxoglutarate/acetoin dehydrogenase E1 component